MPSRLLCVYPMPHEGGMCINTPLVAIHRLLWLYYKEILELRATHIGRPEAA